MTKNSVAKAATRKLAAARGVNYTTALRAQTDPSVSARTLGIGGAILPTEFEWHASGDGIATEVRIDLHALATRRPSNQRAHAQSLAATHLAVIRALLALSPNARMSLDVPEDAYKSRCRGFANEDELPSMTHVVELPYLPGGSLRVYATIRGHRGRLTPVISVDHDDKEALAPEALQQFGQHSANILRHVRSTMGDSAQVSDARRSLREPRDAEQPREAGEDVFFHEYFEDAWSADRGLVSTEHESCLCVIGSVPTPSDPEHYSPKCTLSHSSGETRDHVRIYTLGAENDSEKRPAVITMAPYPNHNIERIHARIAADAAAYGFKFRVGHPDDDTYGNGTLPIVMWNPDLIDLP